MDTSLSVDRSWSIAMTSVSIVMRSLEGHRFGQHVILTLQVVFDPPQRLAFTTPHDA
jgi:hypothetical protein